jgi:hypothetical protein
MVLILWQAFGIVVGVGNEGCGICLREGKVEEIVRLSGDVRRRGCRDTRTDGLFEAEKRREDLELWMLMCVMP